MTMIRKKAADESEGARFTGNRILIVSFDWGGAPVKIGDWVIQGAEGGPIIALDVTENHDIAPKSE